MKVGRWSDPSSMIVSKENRLAMAASTNVRSEILAPSPVSALSTVFDGPFYMAAPFGSAAIARLS